MRTITIVAASLALMSLIACEPPRPAALSEGDVAAIKKIEQDWVKAIVAGDWAAATAMHTEDAVRMPPNRPAVRGRAAIEATLAQLGAVTDCSISTAEVNGWDGFAWSWETYSITIVPSGASEPITETGKGLVVWQKGTDGAWLAHRVAWNSDNPPAAMSSPTR